jgi:hypothetical protein
VGIVQGARGGLAGQVLHKESVVRSGQGAKRETTHTPGPATPEAPSGRKAFRGTEERQPGGTGECVILAAHRRH